MHLSRIELLTVVSKWTGKLSVSVGLTIKEQEREQIRKSQYRSEGDFGELGYTTI